MEHINQLVKSEHTRLFETKQWVEKTMHHVEHAKRFVEQFTNGETEQVDYRSVLHILKRCLKLKFQVSQWHHLETENKYLILYAIDQPYSQRLLFGKDRRMEARSESEDLSHLAYRMLQGATNVMYCPDYCKTIRQKQVWLTEHSN